MGAYSNKEQQPVPPRYKKYGGSSSRRHLQEDDTCTPSECLCVIFIGLVVAVCVVAFFWYVYQADLKPDYTIVITGISGLMDPVVSDMKQGGVLLNPVFNLTVGIASNSMLYGACIDPKTVIKLSYSYLDLPLATGRVPDMCVGPLESSDRPVVASGSNVPMPGFLIDTLAKEIRSGEAMFGVELHKYMQKYGRWFYVLSRWVGIGDAAVARPGAKDSFGQLSEPTKNVLELQPSF